MRLRAGLPVLWQGTTRVRLGTDPRWSVVLADLSPAAARALPAVERGADERALRRALTTEDVPPAEVDAVLAALRAAHLMTDAPAPPAEAVPWALLEADGDGAAVLGARAEAAVRVCGLGPLGARLAVTLAASGVGTLVLEDASPLTRADVGSSGLAVRDVGGPRAGAVARLVHDAAPTVRTPPVGEADLVVLVEHGVADPVRHRPLVQAGTPHLSVVLREASVLVGPLVRPGSTACLRCADQHRTDADPDWPTVAAQLAGRPGGAEEPLLAAVAGALAAAQAVSFLDGRTAAVTDASLEVRLPDLVPRRVAWPVHPECGCGGLPDA